jgi:uncharacterized membrane protein
MNTPRPQSIVFKIETVLQTLWVGGMWVIGYVVAPILFATLDDRRLAGELAGHMFTAINLIGLVCGGILLLSALYAARPRYLNRRVVILLAMLVLICVLAFVIQPMMQELKQSGLVEGGDTMKQFGRLHGVSSVIYLINSLLGMWLLLGRRAT